MDKYRMICKKGEGSFSEVLKCQNVVDGTYWACKKMKQKYDSIEELNQLREIQALRYLNRNIHILQLAEVIYEKKTGTLNLILELMEMNLYEFLKHNYIFEHYRMTKEQQTYLTRYKVADCMLQLLKAVEYIHRNGYFHRDIKPENILLNDNILKLGDFGSVKRIDSEQPFTEYVSTRWYRPPECLLTSGYYAAPMDIWSIGCVMFELINLCPLFPGSSEIDQIDRIHDLLGTPNKKVIDAFKKQSRTLKYEFKPKKGIGIENRLQDSSKDAVSLIKLLLEYNPYQRINAHTALNHRYFKFLHRYEMEKNKKASRSTSTNEINVGNAANATHTHQTLHSDLGHIGHLKQNGGDVEKKMTRLSRKFDTFGAIDRDRGNFLLVLNPLNVPIYKRDATRILETTSMLDQSLNTTVDSTATANTTNADTARYYNSHSNHMNGAYFSSTNEKIQLPKIDKPFKQFTMMKNSGASTLGKNRDAKQLPIMLAPSLRKKLMESNFNDIDD